MRTFLALLALSISAFAQTSPITLTRSTQALVYPASGTINFGSVTITAPIVAANEASDTTCFPLFVTAATGSALKTNTGLTFDAATGAFVFPQNVTITGDISNVGDILGVNAIGGATANFSGDVAAGSFSGGTASVTTLTTTANIELGHASANTLSASGGVLSIEGVELAKRTGGNTFTGTQVFPSGQALIAPVLGAATGTSLALGGATIGSNALAVTGTSTLSSTLTVNVPAAIGTRLFAVGNGSGTDMFSVSSTGTGTFAASVFGADIRASSTGEIYWNGRAELFSPATNTLQIGANHATTPTAQTFKAHDVTTGTGASLTLTGGKGSVAGGAVILATSVTNGAPATAVTIGTDQSATFAGPVIGAVQALSGAGAANVTTLTTALTTASGGAAADALTLANGAAGQIKTIALDVLTDVGDTSVLTPTTKTGFSTVTFTAAGQTVMLQYFTTRGWMVIGSYGATIAP